MNQLDLSKFKKGQTPQSLLKEQTKRHVSKWAETGLLDGLETDQEVGAVAVMLENQHQRIIKEATTTGTAAGNEEWSGVALPLVRRIYGEIVAKELLSVQPMNMPSGIIFYLQYEYDSEGQPGFNPGENIHGNLDTPGKPTGGLYGRGRFNYSINTYETSGVSFANATSGVEIAELNKAAGLFQRVGADEQLVNNDGTPVLSDTLYTFRVEVGTNGLVDPDLDGVTAFNVMDASGTTNPVVGTLFPRHTRTVRTPSNTFVEFVLTLDDTSFVLDDGTTAGDGTVIVQYQKQPTAGNRGDFEDRSSNSNISGTGGLDVDQGSESLTGYEALDIPEVKMTVDQKPIVSKTRKLKAVWTQELLQDLNAYHSVDAEDQLTATLSEHVGMEIDSELLDMLLQNASTKEYWNAKPGWEYQDDSTGGGPRFENLNSHTGTKNEWYETLGTKIQKVSNRIYQKTMRGNANFMMCSPEVSTILESIQGYAADTGGDLSQYAMGVQRVGSLYQQMTVYKNPYMQSNIILVGYRGNQFFETGAVYAPYIPIMMSPVVHDPNNMTPRRAISTRYAKRIVRPEFYGMVAVGGLSTV